MTILIRQATKSGYIEMCNGGVCDLSEPNSATRRGRVQGGGMISPTMMTSGNNLFRITVYWYELPDRRD